MLILGSRQTHPRFHVLDTTDPDQIAAVAAEINPANTLFIVSLILFIGGMLLFGLSFSTAVPALLFALGILLVAASLALPFHFGTR